MGNEYKENEVLKDYVLEYFYHLFTDLERFGFIAVTAKEKATEPGPNMAKKIIDRWGSNNSPDVVEALSKGHEAFREAVFQRLMNEHSEKIEINRCPKCNKIARTPKAKQCRWCFYKWH